MRIKRRKQDEEPANVKICTRQLVLDTWIRQLLLMRATTLSTEPHSSKMVVFTLKRACNQDTLRNRLF